MNFPSKSRSSVFLLKFSVKDLNIVTTGREKEFLCQDLVFLQVIMQNEVVFNGKMSSDDGWHSINLQQIESHFLIVTTQFIVAVLFCIHLVKFHVKNLLIICITGTTYSACMLCTFYTYSVWLWEETCKRRWMEKTIQFYG